jgi:hypothetical protein
MKRLAKARYCGVIREGSIDGIQFSKMGIGFVVHVVE